MFPQLKLQKTAFWLVMLGILLAGITQIGTGHAAEKLRIGTEGAYPPFNVTDTAGHLSGFDIDIANALCHEMKVECEMIAQDWDGLIPALNARKYDAIIASMSITPERKNSVDFTNKYYETPVRFIAPKTGIKDISPEGLKGKVIGAQTATISANFLQDVYGDKIDIRFYDTQEQANMDLIAGRVDALIADSIILDSTILKNTNGKNYHFVGPPLTGKDWPGFCEGIGIAIRKNNQALVEKFNTAIKTIRVNGVYETIRKKYFDFDIYGE